MLIDILTRCSTAQGTINFADAAYKASWIDKVNVAAKKLYEQNNLLGALESEFFSFDIDDTQLIALPSRILKPIRFRHDDNGIILSAQATSNRFNQIWPYDWDKFTFIKRGPISCEHLNAGPLTFTLTHVEAAPVTVSVSGKTNLSTHHVETLVIPAGSLAVTTVSLWRDIKSLTKTVCTYDVLVTNIDDTEIARLPNHLKESLYSIYRLQDNLSYDTSLKRSLLEVLYKPVYRPMLQDNDSFQCDERYEDAIFCKVMEQFYMENPDSVDDALKLANYYNNRCESVLAELQMQYNPGDNKIDFGQNRFLAAQGAYGTDDNRLFRRY